MNSLKNFGMLEKSRLLYYRSRNWLFVWVRWREVSHLNHISLSRCVLLRLRWKTKCSMIGRMVFYTCIISDWTSVTQFNGQRSIIIIYNLIIIIRFKVIKKIQYDNNKKYTHTRHIYYICMVNMTILHRTINTYKNGININNVLLYLFDYGSILL